MATSSYLNPPASASDLRALLACATLPEGSAELEREGVLVLVSAPRVSLRSERQYRVLPCLKTDGLGNSALVGLSGMSSNLKGENLGAAANVWGCKQRETTGSGRLRFGGFSALWPAHASYRRKPRTQGRVVLISYRLLRVSACLPAAISSTGNQNSFPRSLVLSLDFVQLSNYLRGSSFRVHTKPPSAPTNAPTPIARRYAPISTTAAHRPIDCAPILGPK